MKKRIFVLRSDEFRHRLIALISELDLTRPKQITVSDYRKSRSTNQNSLLWMWMHEIADDTGHTAEEIHEFCKRQFLTPQTIEINGNAVDIPPSTTKLTTSEFTDYLERIQSFAGAELSLMLTQPDASGWQ